jgi:ATP-dependent Clp protease adaptor protein ClpS
MKTMMATATLSTSHFPPHLGALSPEQDKETDLLVLVDKGYRLIVWNDEVNTFEWVIETLMEVCGHERIQAEQCAWLIHTRGKYAVKNGDYDTLKPMCDAITERGIGATIESAA